MMSQTIILDLGKVMCPFDVLIPCRKLAERTMLDPHDIKQLIFLGEPEIDFETGRSDEQQFTRECNRLLNLSMTVDEFRSIWSDMFQLDHAMMSLVEELKRDNQLLLLSNTSPWHFAWVEYNFAISRHFDGLILSYEVGAMKPDEPIYRAALKKADNPDTAIFIDDLPENVIAAERLGIRALLFQGEPHLRAKLRELNIL
jgi:putative hydrolase of the HAD superfamily